MEVIDAQVHSWQHPRKRNWISSYRGSNQDSFPIDATIAAMDAVGVDGAVLDVIGEKEDGTLSATVYGEWCAERYPERIASVMRYDHRSPKIGDLVAGTRRRIGVLAIRIQLKSEDHVRQYGAGEYTTFFSAAQEHHIPIWLYVTGQLRLAARIAHDYPDATLIIDHLGLPQPPSRLCDDPPFRRIGELLDLAQSPNVSIKFIGAPAYSKEKYPYSDIWPYLHQVIDAFGIERLMWGSDFTRLRGLFTYAELVHYLRDSREISEVDKELIFGANLRRILGWPRQPDM